MTLNQYKLTNMLLEDYFGPSIATIAENLKWGPRPLKLLSTNSKLPLATVKHALSILINFNIVGFKASIHDVNSCEYFLLPDNIIHFMRYPRFILLIGKKYGKEAEYVIKELLFSGRMRLARLIANVTTQLIKNYPEIQYRPSTIMNTISDLIENNFIIPMDKVPADKANQVIIPVPIKLTYSEKIADVNRVKALINDIAKLSVQKQLTTLFSSEKEMDLFWKVNFEKFMIEFRNDILVSAVSRKFGKPSAIVMQNLLKSACTDNDPWRPVSNPVPMMLLRGAIGDDPEGSTVLQYLNQYTKEMEDDPSSFIGKSIDYSHGTIICYKDAFYSLSVECLHLIINQKFGSKAARVFNIIRDKKFIELEQIQRLAMLADKEAKNITYKLLEENFIQMQELKKPTTGLAAASGPNKTFILFSVDYDMVIKMVVNMAYKSIYNIKMRLREEKSKYSHLIEKKKQADLVATTLKEQNASEEQISELINNILSPPEMALLERLKKITKKLELAQLQIDETIILLQIYMLYYKTYAPETKLKKKK